MAVRPRRHEIMGEGLRRFKSRSQLTRCQTQATAGQKLPKHSSMGAMDECLRRFKSWPQLTPCRAWARHELHVPDLKGMTRRTEFTSPRRPNARGRSRRERNACGSCARARRWTATSAGARDQESARLLRYIQAPQGFFAISKLQFVRFKRCRLNLRL